MKSSRRFAPTPQEMSSLEATARYCSISAAAQELHLAQPTISYHIKKLEDKWGVVLFRKKGRNLEPSEFLHAILPEIQTMTRQLEHIGKMVSGQYLRKVLSISVSPSLAIIVLQRRLNGFLDSFPSTSVRIFTSNQFLNLEKERIDIALRLLPRPDKASVQAKNNILIPVPEECLRVVCSPGYFTRITGHHTPPASPDGSFFSKAQLIQEDGTMVWNDYFTKFWPDLQLDLQHNLTYNNADLILQTAVSGNGVALLRDIYVMDALREGQLVEPFAMRLRCDRVFQFVTPEFVGLTPATYNFASWFGKELAELVLDPGE